MRDQKRLAEQTPKDIVLGYVRVVEVRQVSQCGLDRLPETRYGVPLSVQVCRLQNATIKVGDQRSLQLRRLPANSRN